MNTFTLFLAMSSSLAVGSDSGSPIADGNTHTPPSNVISIHIERAGKRPLIVKLLVEERETVLDAIGRSCANSEALKKKRMALARPLPEGGGYMILPIEFREIAETGATSTNYLLFPHDRIYATNPAPPKK